MNRYNSDKRRHLYAVKEEALPRTLREYADGPNIDARLEYKLGQDCLWLFANEFSAIERRHTTTAVYYDDTVILPVPVRYECLRNLTDIEDAVEYPRIISSRPVPYHETVAIFRITKYINLKGDGELIDGRDIYDFDEIAVRLDQPITLLEKSEYTPGRAIEFMQVEKVEKPKLVYRSDDT